jgi:predicted HTH transcriptional regulator
MGGNEPLKEKAPEPVKEEREPRKREEKDELPQKQRLGLLRQMAQATIQLRIQKKLVKVMTLFASQTEITNDEVEKLLHVSDVTATRYLAELEKRDKIRQVGTTGRGVKYVKL